MSQKTKNYSNKVNVEFRFDDKDFKDFKELAAELNISVEGLIAGFFNEGVRLTWDTVKSQANKQSKK